MKKTLLYLVLMVLYLQASAQHGISIIRSSNQVSVSTTGAEYPVVKRTSNTLGAAEPDTTKRITIWMEHGDGYYTTDAGDVRNISGTQSHSTFLLSTKLYDTTKEQKPLPSRITYNNDPVTAGSFSASATQYLEGGVRLKITPNAYDIVPGDTMAFAIGYRAGVDQDPVGNQEGGLGRATKLWFFYNNNTAFNALTSNGVMVSSADPIQFCRKHNGESVSFPSIPDGINRDMYDEKYDNCILFSLTDQLLYNEKNVFVSLVPRTDLEIGKSSSVYVVLTDDKNNVIATDIIPNMRVAPAHDPNYIVQRPVCLLAPKKVYPFTYTIHFQNTGAGDANEVKVIAQLPEGMDWGSLKIKEAVFAGMDYSGMQNSDQFIIRPQDGDKLEIIFKAKDASHYLKGTNVVNPATNPQTMGEITFTINSTPETKYTLQAFADIYFRSVYKSENADSAGYEKPVRTNIQTTSYKNCCEKGCKPIEEPGCCGFLGLCWWLWVLILLVIAGFIFFIVWRRHRKKNQQPGC